MMKWLITGCLLIVITSFIWPFLGIQDYGRWLFFGLIFLSCQLPMLLMKKNKKNEGS